MTKDEIRSRMLKKLRNQKKSDNSRKSKIIKEKLFSLEEFKKAKNIFCYISLASEADTKGIIVDALGLGKHMFAPRVEQDALGVAEIKDLDKDLEEGPLGILQPREDLPRLSPPEVLDIAIVPGIAFDRKGSRLGRGKGYFDRFLKQLADTAVKTVGIAFDFQILKSIPQNSSDIPVNLVISN